MYYLLEYPSNLMYILYVATFLTTRPDRGQFLTYLVHEHCTVELSSVTLENMRFITTV